MSRKNKIIVSIVGITIVLLTLIGLTYAYYLTRIQGNTNNKSISIATANLMLKYGEETQNIITKESLMPGEIAVTKVFSATNEGNSDVIYGAALENIVNELTRQEDLVYRLECTSYLKDGFSLAKDGTITGTIDGDCEGATNENQFPNTSNLSVMVTNTIDANHTHAYKLIITYKNLTDIDQSVDMNKSFSAKVNLVDTKALKETNLYKDETDTLRKTIIDNAILGFNTTLGEEVNEFTGISERNEKVLNIASDDYGTSYYYRGNIIDNYVNFANKTWRIVRINGDGSIRIILNDNVSPVLYNNEYNDNAYVGYMYGLTNQSSGTNQCIKLNAEGTAAEIETTKTTENDCLAAGYKWTTTAYEATHVNVVDSNIKKELDKWYESNLTSYANYLADTLFCGDKTFASDNTGTGVGQSFTKYAAFERNKTKSKPSLICAQSANDDFSRYSTQIQNLKNGNKTNGDLKYPIGLLSADEISLIGGKYSMTNSYTYLSNNDIDWWTMSPYLFFSDKKAYTFYVAFNSGNALFTLANNVVNRKGNFGIYFRPVINLKKDIKFTGTGTNSDPYKIITE